MIDYTNNNNTSPQYQQQAVNSEATVRSFLTNVFSYMGGASVITGLIAYWFASSPALMSLLVDIENGGYTFLGLAVLFSPIVFVLVMNLAFNRLSSLTLLLLLIAFSAVMGMFFSFVFLIYTASSVASTFFITAGTFGFMAFLGYTTKQDLTKFGTILYMALIGLIIAMVVNFFMASAAIDYIISCAGVLIFTGLTAYKVQYLKRVGSGVEYGTESTNKLAIIASLSLYLTFINLFLFLLRLFGDRR